MALLVDVVAKWMVALCDGVVLNGSKKLIGV
jgi:hypothetical protein